MFVASQALVICDIRSPSGQDFLWLEHCHSLVLAVSSQYLVGSCVQTGEIYSLLTSMNREPMSMSSTGV